MPEKTQNISVDEAVGALLENLPGVIRDFVQGPERDKVALELMQKYGLHVDQGGVFQLAYLQMLLGAISPDEFSKTLTDAGISKEITTSLMGDLNEMVFKPLREKEREASEKPKPEAPKIEAPRTSPPPPSYHPEIPVIREPVVQPAPIVAPEPAPTPVAEPLSTPAPPEQPSVQKYVQPPANLPGATPPLKPLYPSYTSAPRVSDHMPRPNAQAVVSGTVRTMQSDMVAINEHKEPVPHPYHMSTSLPVQERPLMQTPTPVSSIPTPAEPAPTREIKSAMPARPSVTPTPTAELVKEYSVDPYREPLS